MLDLLGRESRNEQKDYIRGSGRGPFSYSTLDTDRDLTKKLKE
jgi:hypothetical protein